jgi:hypothetical protein
MKRKNDVKTSLHSHKYALPTSAKQNATGFSKTERTHPTASTIRRKKKNRPGSSEKPVIQYTREPNIAQSTIASGRYTIAVDKTNDGIPYILAATCFNTTRRTWTAIGTSAMPPNARNIMERNESPGKHQTRNTRIASAERGGVRSKGPVPILNWKSRLSVCQNKEPTINPINISCMMCTRMNCRFRSSSFPWRLIPI